MNTAKNSVKLCLISLLSCTLLSSCATTPIYEVATACPPLTAYNADEKKLIADEWEKINSPIIDSVIIDYFQLRAACKVGS